MYMMYKTYTVAEFRKNTREILNEALTAPIRIKRFNDEFIISNADPENYNIKQNKDGTVSPSDTKASSKLTNTATLKGFSKELDGTTVTIGKLDLCKTHGLPTVNGRKTCLMKGCK